MNTVGERDEFEDVVARILSHFDLEVTRRRAWRGTLADLRRVLRTDYEERVAGYVAAGEFPIDDLQRAVRSTSPTSTASRWSSRRRSIEHAIGSAVSG